MSDCVKTFIFGSRRL